MSSSPSTEWKEEIPAEEEARLIKHAEAMLEVQQRRAAARTTKDIDRSLHAKGNLGVEAELQIHGNLPAPARAGLFAKEATYRTYLRYSNGSGMREHDSKPDVRGLAMKVVGVPGKKVIPGMEDAQTQDFLLIRTPTIPFRNADEFVGVVTAVSGSQVLAVPRMISRIGFGRTFALLKLITAGFKVPILSMATTTYFTAAPMRCGDYAMKVSLEARAKDTKAAPKDTPTWLGDDLAKRIAKAPISYDLRIQLYVDEQTTPIEDPTVEWPSEWVTVGRLTIPQQDLSSERSKKVSDYIETLSFDPWHALVEHRPLGNIMRARNHAYRLSTKERSAAKEPTGDEVF